MDFEQPGAVARVKTKIRMAANLTANEVLVVTGLSSDF
jgi:hypothetical protein